MITLTEGKHLYLKQVGWQLFVNTVICKLCDGMTNVTNFYMLDLTFLSNKVLTKKTSAIVVDSVHYIQL